MNRYENYIYITICEVSLTLFKKTHYLSYKNYCKNMSKSLIGNDLSINEKSDLFIISEVIELIFSLPKEKISEYITNFFICNKFEKFEMIVRQTEELFPNCNDFNILK